MLSNGASSGFFDRYWHSSSRDVPLINHRRREKKKGGKESPLLIAYQCALACEMNYDNSARWVSLSNRLPN